MHGCSLLNKSLLMRGFRFSTWPFISVPPRVLEPNGEHRSRKARRLIADDEGSGDGERNNQSGADNDVVHRVEPAHDGGRYALVTADNAAVSEVIMRHPPNTDLQSNAAELERREAALDDTIEQSFPASDPLSSDPNPDNHDAITRETSEDDKPHPTKTSQERFL